MSVSNVGNVLYPRDLIFLSAGYLTIPVECPEKKYFPIFGGENIVMWKKHSFPKGI